MPETDIVGVAGNHSRFRLLACGAVLGAFVVANLLTFAVRTADQWSMLRHRDGPDPVSAADARFGEVLPFLPAYGPVGYVKPGFDRANLDDLAEFFQAQFALAPRLVVDGTAAAVVVGVAREGMGLPAPPNGFEELRRFGDGLAIYRRVAP